MVYSLEIYDPYIPLSDILNQLTKYRNYNWYVFDIETMGTNEAVEIDDKSPEFYYDNMYDEGKEFTWDQLHIIAKRYVQIVELTLVGNKDGKQPQRPEVFEDIYKENEITIEMCDSTLWIFHSSKESVISKLKYLETQEYLKDRTPIDLLIGPARPLGDNNTIESTIDVFYGIFLNLKIIEYLVVNLNNVIDKDLIILFGMYEKVLQNRTKYSNAEVQDIISEIKWDKAIGDYKLNDKIPREKILEFMLEFLKIKEQEYNFDLHKTTELLIDIQKNPKKYEEIHTKWFKTTIPLI